MPTLPASLGSSLFHVVILLLLLMDDVLLGLLQVQLVQLVLAVSRLLLHDHVLVRYLLLGTILRKLRYQSLLLLRKHVGVLLGLRDGIWIGLDWVHLRLTLADTA